MLLEVIVRRAWQLFLIEMTSLLVANIISGLLLAIFTEPIIRIPAGSLIAIISPGYLILRYIYPQGDGEDQLWILGLMIPTGTAFTGGVLLALNYFWEYSFGSSVLIIVVVNICAIIGLVCLSARDRNSRLVFSWSLVVHQSLRTHSALWRSNKFIFLSAFPLLFLVGSVIFAITYPKRAISLTEFYVLSPTRRITGPILSNNQMMYGVINREGDDLEYEIVVLASSGSTTEELWSETIFVKNGDFVERDVTIPEISSVFHKLELLLFKGGERQPYRSLSVPIMNVVEY